MPEVTILPITQECNQKCLFCSAEGRNETFRQSFFKKIIAQTSKTLVISGGEPTLSHDLLWVINKAKSRGLFVELQTNGATLFYKKISEALISADVDLFNINFPSHISHIHDQITQTTGMFAKKVTGIDHLAHLQARTRLTHVINALNYEALEDFVFFVSKRMPDIEFIQFSFLKIMGMAKKHPGIIVTYAQVEPYLLSALAACQKYGLRCMVDHIPLCYMGQYMMYHVDYQKIKNQKALRYALKEKSKIAQCQSCHLSRYCLGFRKDYIRYHKPEENT